MIDFWYPSDVTRPYLPDPKGIFEQISQNLTDVGFKIQAHTATWNPDYLDAEYAGERRGDLCYRKLHAGDRTCVPADFADPQRVQPLIDRDHPDRGHRDRLHLAVRHRRRDSAGLGASPTPPLFGRRRVSPPRYGRPSCLGWCSHSGKFPFP